VKLGQPVSEGFFSSIYSGQEPLEIYELLWARCPSCSVLPEYIGRHTGLMLALAVQSLTGFDLQRHIHHFMRGQPVLKNLFISFVLTNFL